MLKKSYKDYVQMGMLLVAGTKIEDAQRDAGEEIGWNHNMVMEAIKGLSDEEVVEARRIADNLALTDEHHLDPLKEGVDEQAE